MLRKLFGKGKKSVPHVDNQHLLEELSSEGNEMISYIKSQCMFVAMDQYDGDVDKVISSLQVDDIAAKGIGIGTWNKRKFDYQEFLSNWERKVKEQHCAAVGIPGCFGEMPNSIYYKSYGYASVARVGGSIQRYYRFPDWEEAVRRTEDKGHQFIEYVQQLVQCAHCPMFDRCYKLSFVRQFEDKELTLG